MSRKIIRLRDVVAKTGLSQATIYDQISKGRFPKQIKLGPKAAGWVEDEIDAHIETLIAARDKVA